MSLGLNDEPLELPESEVSDITFASAEARFELLRARRFRLVLHIIGMVLVVLAALVFSLVIRARRTDGGSVASSLLGGGPHPPASLNIDPVGSEDAKVQVVAVLPAGSDCHSGVAKFLSDTATAHPDEIHVSFVSMEEFSNDKLKNKIGQVCAAILINDKATFEIMKHGKLASVSLIGSEPTNYKMSDVGEALTQVYTKEYGAPAEPIYKLETPTCGDGSCSSAGHGGGAEGPSASQEDDAPIDITLPGKLPAIK
jgi:hypothetical protein